MADKSVSLLTPVKDLTGDELFVVQQDNQAKSVGADYFMAWWKKNMTGHGGISSISEPVRSGLVDTYTINYADQTTTTFSVTNARSIDSITQYFAVSASNSSVPSYWYTTRQTITPTMPYLWSYFQIAYNNGTSTSTTKTVIAAYGQQGQQGLKGDTGDPAVLTDRVVSYALTTSPAQPAEFPYSDVPSVSPGQYLWTRTRLIFNGSDAQSVVYYSAAYNGFNGTGAGTVTSVNNVQPDDAGNVHLTPEDIGAFAPGENSITSAMLQDNAVTSIKLATNSVARSKIEDGAVHDYYTLQFTLSGAHNIPYGFMIRCDDLITPEDRPDLTPIYSDTNSVAIQEAEAWSCISDANTVRDVNGNSYINFRCLTKLPEQATTLKLQVRVARK